MQQEEESWHTFFGQDPKSGKYTPKAEGAGKSRPGSGSKMIQGAIIHALIQVETKLCPAPSLDYITHDLLQLLKIYIYAQILPWKAVKNSLYNGNQFI